MVDSKEYLSVKTTLISMIKTLDETAYIAKTIELFFSLPIAVQKSFLAYCSEELDRDDWAKWMEDETLYLKTIRAILFFHTGREDLKQPSKQDFKKLVADYIRDGDWTGELDAEERKESAVEFLDELGEI